MAMLGGDVVMEVLGSEPPSAGLALGSEPSGAGWVSEGVWTGPSRMREDGSWTSLMKTRLGMDPA